MLQAACRVFIHILCPDAEISEQCVSTLVHLGWQTMFLVIVTSGCTSSDCCVCVVRDVLCIDLHSATSLQRILFRLREKRAFSVCCLLPSTVRDVQET